MTQNMNNPLVSVPVITYNSSAYIIEGLESIKAQTYKNIELIISDDCSTDNTVELCRDWLEKNKDCFVRVELITTDKNTGVAGNCNRSVKACRGEWIRGLSGDDKFLPNTIQGYVDFINSHPEANICFAKLKFFGIDPEMVKKCSDKYSLNLYPKLNASLKEQQKFILNEMFIPGPGIMYKKKLWEEIGGFDEKYPFCEEDPFFNRILLTGYTIYFIDTELYQYNVRSDSLGNDINIGLIRHLTDRYKYFKDERKYNLFKRGRIFEAWAISLDMRIRLNELKNIEQPLRYKIEKYLNPYNYYRRIINKNFALPKV